jgi:RNAse (barnase) inhibitor barstar
MIYTIDGSNFSDLEGFWQEIERVFSFSISNIEGFERNFSGLRELFAVIPKNTVVVWKNSKISLKKLGHAETIKLLQRTRQNCHSSWQEVITKELEIARYNLGETVFDTIVKIFVEESIPLRLE